MIDIVFLVRLLVSLCLTLISQSNLLTSRACLPSQSDSIDYPSSSGSLTKTGQYVCLATFSRTQRRARMPFVWESPLNPKKVTLSASNCKTWAVLAFDSWYLQQPHPHSPTLFFIFFVFVLFFLFLFRFHFDFHFRFLNLFIFILFYFYIFTTFFLILFLFLFLFCCVCFLFFFASLLS